MRISYSALVDLLPRELPEVRQRWRAEMDWWKGERPPEHVLYGNVLNSYIDASLDSGDWRALERVFAFIERLAADGDERVRELVEVTLCEHLWSDPARLRRMRPYIGSKTATLGDVNASMWNKDES